LTRSESSGVVQKIDEISGALEKAVPFQKEPGLISGKTGSVLFFFYYSRFSGRKHFYNLGNMILEDIFDDINNANFYPTMADGLAGIAWAINHFVSTHFVPEEYLSEIHKLDHYLADVMIEYLRSGEYDYLHGGLGIANYMLVDVDREFSRKKLAEAVKILNQLAIQENGSFHWNSVIDHKNNVSGINLGLSHGQASIVYFLLKAYGEKVLTSAGSKMLHGAIQYLLDVQEKRENSSSVFPNWIINGEPSGESRLAWCYGDPGIGMVLWQAGKILKNKKLESDALMILRKAACKRALDSNGIFDASLCHGSAGLLQIFNRLYQETNDPKFYHAAIYWLSVTLDLSKNENGIAGYKYRNPTKPEGWVNSIGFLEGVAGIGLALLSAVSDERPSWDECLMLG